METLKKQELNTTVETEEIQLNMYETPLKSQIQEVNDNITTICLNCRKSLWFLTKQEIKCYCQPMNAITFTEEEMDEQVMQCDMQIQAEIEAQQQEEE